MKTFYHLYCIKSLMPSSDYKVEWNNRYIDLLGFFPPYTKMSIDSCNAVVGGTGVVSGSSGLLLGIHDPGPILSLPSHFKLICSSVLFCDFFQCIIQVSVTVHTLALASLMYLNDSSRVSCINNCEVVSWKMRPLQKLYFCFFFAFNNSNY